MEDDDADADMVDYATLPLWDGPFDAKATKVRVHGGAACHRE